MQTDNNISTSSNNSQPVFKAAFDETAKERAALFPSDLMTINLDLPLAVATVLGTLPRLATLREEIASTMKSFDIAQYDRIQTYAEALSYAHTAFLAASTPAESLPGLVAHAMTLREQLLSDATALAHRDLVDGKRLAELKGGTGYLNIASDVAVLVRILRERWNDIHTKSAVQVSELDEADQIHERIMFGYAERTVQQTVEATATDDRQRAFVLLVNAYDQARRAATFVRWQEDDVDKILPSLWAQRASGRPSKQTNGNTETPAPAPATGGNGQPVQPIVTTPVAPPVAPVPPGFPGGSPFARG